MIAVANYAMKGPMQALIAVLLLSALTVFFAPFGVLAGALIALITLRIGETDGLKVLAASSVVVIGLQYAVTSSYLAGFITVMEYLLPVWLLSWVLRNTSSLALSLALAMMLTGGALLAFHFSVGDTVAWWHQVFKDYLIPVFQQAQMDYPAEMIDKFAEVATMMVAMFAIVLWFSILLLGRWWQSVLYFPGRFQEDFYQLRLPKGIAALTVLVAIAGLLTQTALLQNLSGVLMVGLMFQGLAVVHHAVKTREMNMAWLVTLYVLLLLIPQTILILATIGLIDTWMDIRNRWSEKN